MLSVFDVYYVRFFFLLSKIELRFDNIVLDSVEDYSSRVSCEDSKCLPKREISFIADWVIIPFCCNIFLFLGDKMFGLG